MEWIPVADANQTTQAPPMSTEVGARKYQGFHPWDLLIIIDLAMLGLSFISGLFMGPSSTSPLADLDPIVLELLLWFNGATTMVMMAVIPVIWLMMTRIGGWQGALTALGMRNGDHSRGYWIGIGCLLAVGLAAAAFGFGYLLEVLGVDPGGDPLFEQIARDGSWALMVGIAITAGVGEEVLFRGVLQKWLRWWGQALVFGLAHVNQGWWAVGFIVGLSALLGYLRHRRVPLWSLMVAHFAYDLILLTILKLQVT